MIYPSDVRIVEVGPRDGLQNEPNHTSVDFRVEFIEKLIHCGFSTIEVGSFVSPKWVPQMADTDKVFERIRCTRNVSLVTLVPNLVGMQNAIRAGVKEIAVFVAASDSFSFKNTNCTVNESLERIKPVLEIAKENQIKVRGYISCVLGCPYEGDISPTQVVPLIEKLVEIGCYEVSLGDTIGIGNPKNTEVLLKAAKQTVEPNVIAVHFHDTYGRALPNILVALDCGITVFDSSTGGLGGCPYAEGASGNVATEDVIDMLERMGVSTGINLNELIDVTNFVFSHLQRPPLSRVSNAMLANRNRT